MIDAITLDAGTAPDGRKHATLSAVAKGAARGGGDARLAFDAKLSGTGEGPISLTVPPIDLVHFKGLVFAATGLVGPPRRVRGRGVADARRDRATVGPA